MAARSLVLNTLLWFWKKKLHQHIGPGLKGLVANARAVFAITSHIRRAVLNAL